MSVLAEISVADADAKTSAIYRGLMQAAGAGAPALIFRHMATYPGLLEWVWHAVGPDLSPGWPSQAVWGIVRAQPVVSLPPLTAGDLAGLGVDSEGRLGISRTVANYNRMNPVMLVTIGALRILMRNDAIPETTAGFPTDTAALPPPLSELPAPPRVADLDPELRAILAELRRTLPDAGSEVTPTLYRHLSLWPLFMAELGRRIADRLDDMDRATHVLADACGPLIHALAKRAEARISAPAPLPDPAPLLKVMDSFAYVIPHMVAVGAAVEKALPE